MAEDDGGLVTRMEMLLVEVQTTRNALETKTREIEQLKLSRDRPMVKRADNAGIQQMQRDIEQRREELRSVQGHLSSKMSEHERAKLRFKELERKLEALDLEEKGDEKFVEELRAKNKALQTALRKVQKELLVKEQETKRAETRLQEVRGRHRRLKDQEGAALKTLTELGYSVRDLDQIRATVEKKESDLITIEEISDMMDDAIQLLDSAVETAKLEHDVLEAANQSGAGNQSQRFERSALLRLWRAYGMAACAVYKAMKLGRQREDQYMYVDAEQVHHAQEDINARLRETDLVKAKLDARVEQMKEAEDAAKGRLQETMAERDAVQKEKSQLDAKLQDPEANEESMLRRQVPQAEERRRMAELQVNELTTEWKRVDAVAKKKYETVDKAIDDHLNVLEWEKAEMQQISERVAAIKAREMKVVEKRLSLEQAQLDSEIEPDGMPEEFRKLM